MTREELLQAWPMIQWDGETLPIPLGLIDEDNKVFVAIGVPEGTIEILDITEHDDSDYIFEYIQNKYN